jgi:hypothetical protein
MVLQIPINYFKNINMRHNFLLCICLSFFSCGPSYNCDASAESYRSDECILIVERIPRDIDNIFDYRGINPITKKGCDCNSNRSGKWWSLYSDHIEIGDTIIKKKGELIFSIHKKDTVLSFNFECDGKIYK